MRLFKKLPVKINVSVYKLQTYSACSFCKINRENFSVQYRKGSSQLLYVERVCKSCVVSTLERHIKEKSSKTRHKYKCDCGNIDILSIFANYQICKYCSLELADKIISAIEIMD